MTRPRTPPLARRIDAVLAAALLTVLVAVLASVTAARAHAEPMPPHAYQRLDRVGAALAKDPLFVDPDLAPLLGRADRERVRAAMTAATAATGAPVRVVVLPNPTDSESRGDDDVFLQMLHERTGRDAYHVLVTDRGYITAAAYGVPGVRYGGYDDGFPPDTSAPAAQLTERIVHQLDGYRLGARRDRAVTPRVRTPAPWNEEDRPLRSRDDGPEIAAPLLTGLLLAGPLLGLLLLGVPPLARALGARRRRATGRDAPLRATPRHLSRTAAREIDGLRGDLAAADGNPGEAFAGAAYDAAHLLLEDVTRSGGAERSGDLLTALVLARRGRRALADRDARPATPCFINPLHGPSARKRPIPGRGASRRVCGACADAPRGALAGRYLRVHDDRGRFVRHDDLGGLWAATGHGTRHDPAPRILEHLGVD
ncbi:hypothetical protein [Actinomadura flavalba]|uniref:hypothetical protein n=1 Tax=Actinomadura flavalba TaxID=1120938 RepID=UPI00035F675A|nr:hypothetical protein [Actinomadura flavalba]